MGTQIFNGETTADAESIIKYTRKPKKPPEYVPRSRSLGDLPGGLRVPIIKKPESRLQQKHEANLAGLEELKMLRQKHDQMMDDLKTLLPIPEAGPKRSSPIKLSTSQSLACIKEEPFSHSYDNDTESQYSKARFSIASDGSHTISSGKSDSISDSIESLPLTSRETEDQLEIDSRSREQILADFRRKFDKTCVGPPPLQPRRRASIQVETITNRLPPPVDRTIRPKLRRASFQCEAVLTKTSEREEPVSKVISDFKLQYNFPSPLHAVTRQYGSSSDIRVKDKKETSPSAEKDLKTILKEWQIEKCAKTKPTVSKNTHDQTGQPSDKLKTGTHSGNHSRNTSLTSDYFGSTETLNTVRTFPLPDRGNDQMLPRRRQSLPMDLTRTESQTVPKLPERRRSFIDKQTSGKTSDFPQKTTKNQESVKHVRTTSVAESDDGIFNDEDNLTTVKEDTAKSKGPTRLSTNTKLTLETAL